MVLWFCALLYANKDYLNVGNGICIQFCMSDYKADEMQTYRVTAWSKGGVPTEEHQCVALCTKKGVPQYYGTPSFYNQC